MATPTDVAGLPVIVLAGGTPRAGEPLWAETRGEPKALLDLGGRPMVQRVLDALAEARSAGPVVLVGLAAGDEVTHPGGLLRVAARGTFVDNLYAGIEELVEAAPESDRALYVGSDLPLVRGEMVDRFVERAREIEADVVAGLVPREDLLRRFPALRERWLRLSEGRFVAADLALFRPAAAARARPHLEALAPRRKSAWRQARQVGLGLLVRYLLGRLSIPALERRLERAYGIRGRVLVCRDPELGLDVDGPVNLEICRRALPRAGAGPRAAAGGGRSSPPGLHPSG